jgi:glycosyltransferase
MNKGIAMAGGEVVGCLNADDMLAHERVLERIAGVFADPAVDACYGDLVYVDPLHTARVVRYWHSGVVSERDFRLGLMPAHPTFYLRRSVLEKVGLFDLSLRSANDFEMTLRCLHVFQLRAVYVPEILVKMRMGGFSNRSLTGVVRQNRDIIRALGMHGLKPSLLYPLGKLLVKLRQYVRRPEC